MGLFSFLNKNKQEPTAGGYHSRDDDDDAAIGAKARSKRASNAGEGAAKRAKEARADPVLPEKKRARRRLVGAIALALAVAVGLPMILDSEPKPLATDIDIRIPAKDKAPAQPAPAPVAAADALDQRETIVEAPKATPAPAAAAREVAEVKLASAKPDIKKPEPKAPEKIAVKVAEPKPVEPNPAEVKHPAAKPDTERALAILEDKAPEAKPQKYIVQVAALASQEKVDELQGKLKEAGIPSFTQKGSGKSGELIRVRVGPFSKEEGEKIRAKLSKLGLSGTVTPQS
jgi:DedD protein